MRKIKLAIGLLAVWLLGLFVVAKSAFAANISITQLPAYITSNSFKLSYSCLGCTSVQFYVNKHGAGWIAFGPVMIDASGQVQVSSSEVNDQTDYIFKVVDSGAVGEASTSTFYDVSGPSPVQNYYKEGAGSAFNKLHWKNPGDSDFAQVVIYRADSQGFSADSSHEIARVSGGAGSDMTYDDHTPDASKTYYYLLRALDKAGNSSSLVGDGGTTITVSPTPGGVLGASSKSSGKVTQLPKEEGSVLGSQASPTPTPSATPESGTETIGQNAGLFSWIMGHKKISLGAVLLISLLTWLVWKYIIRK